LLDKINAIVHARRRDIEELLKMVQLACTSRVISKRQVLSRASIDRKDAMHVGSQRWLQRNDNSSLLPYTVYALLLGRGVKAHASFRIRDKHLVGGIDGARLRCIVSGEKSSQAPKATGRVNAHSSGDFGDFRIREREPTRLHQRSSCK